MSKFIHTCVYIETERACVMFELSKIQSQIEVSSLIKKQETTILSLMINNFNIRFCYYMDNDNHSDWSMLGTCPLSNLYSKNEQRIRRQL